MPFLRRLAGRRGLAAAVGRHPLRVATSLIRRDRDALKETVVGEIYRGRRVVDVRAAGEAFARDVERTRLRPDLLARLRWHQRQGHRTALVSASMCAYLDPLAASLGIDDVLCTDVVADDGVHGHALLGGNCRGQEKVVRLRALLEREGLDDVPLWVYGDSAGDRPMLAIADHPVWVTKATVLAVPTGFDG